MESKQIKTSVCGGDNNVDTSEEKKKMALMRAFVERRDPNAKEVVDDLTLRRFLRARDLDIEKASAMFLKCLKWRKTAVPNGFVSETEVPNELAQAKVFMQGRDKAGRPIGVVFGAKHFYSTREMDEFKRLVVYVLDKLCASMTGGQEKFVGIVDLQGWGYSNCDIRGYVAALDIMQNYYPERLGKAYMVHVPYLFMKAWKIIYPFIDNNTRKKIVFVENKNLKATLMEDIEESQLPQRYGGELPLVPIEKSAM
ncbi:CRAL/TRIO domain [Musa troglodytarum]|uniref:CRAL/TRIO domain n=1 Tax=Musa troglodytarum TaxID=320322 RepID=A0A9E7L0C7_9LILI|nr:CRAL/TRIO domain [Musa troglodytarum]